jgi:EAL domain-containing protein (putative c-di-GMP-specific phosphodiesterase class I)/GGDEF domain-containing protein
LRASFFTSLRTRLTVLYAGLFCVALLTVGATAYVAAAANAQSQVERELASGGAVFDRLWALRESQLADGAAVLSRDFGFRAAVGTRDAPTVSSALDNLRGRLNLDKAFMVGVDGDVTGLAVDHETATALWTALDAGSDAGVLTLSGTPYQAIAAPVMAPDLRGWLVFAVKLDRRELASLEKLSSIPLTAAVVKKSAAGAWSSEGLSKLDERRLSTFTADALKARDGAANATRTPQRLTLSAGKSIALVKPLKAIDGQAATALVLRYPLSAALAPYRSLLWVLVVLGLGSLFALIFGSWLLARSITRPVSALDEAAHRLERGEDASVDVVGRDEIGRLAVSFNAMAAGIREREKRITRMAQTDQETGLNNRVALEQALERISQGVVAVVGIERYAQVRSAIGYHLTAAMIGEIGARLAKTCRGCTIARLSSERLGLTLRAASLDEALFEADRILSALQKPLKVEGVAIDVAFTIGLASVDAAAAIPVVERASIALDQARVSGVKIGGFNAADYGDPASKLSLMSEMLGALQDGAITLYYQPKHDLRAGRIAGAEALVRWNHPIRGFVSPDLFVTLAEETGYIRALTLWTLERLIIDQRALRAAGHDPMLSLNLSGRMLGDAGFIDEAILLTRRSGANVCFEITETAMIANPTTALAAVDRLRAAGISISLDDYGSGLSSLAYLKQIPADELKIDKEFVLKLDSNSRDALLVKSTIDLAHSLGLKLVAEGVETAETLALLTAMGCDLAQGYFVARPMPLPALVSFLDDSVAANAKPSRIAKAG